MLKFTNSSQQGNYAEQIVACEFMKKGFEVYQNVGEQNRFDLIVYKDGEGVKTVQVKSTTCLRKDSDAWKVTLETSHRGSKKVPLNKKDLDILAVFVIPLDKVFYFDMNSKDFKNECSLTLSSKKIQNGEYQEDIKGVL